MIPALVALARSGGTYRLKKGEAARKLQIVGGAQLPHDISAWSLLLDPDASEEEKVKQIAQIKPGMELRDLLLQRLRELQTRYANVSDGATIDENQRVLLKHVINICDYLNNNKSRRNDDKAQVVETFITGVGEAQAEWSPRTHLGQLQNPTDTKSYSEMTIRNVKDLIDRTLNEHAISNSRELSKQ